VGRYVNTLVQESGEWYFFENVVTHP
jgi:hypothetical protein